MGPLPRGAHTRPHAVCCAGGVVTSILAATQSPIISLPCRLRYHIPSHGLLVVSRKVRTEGEHLFFYSKKPFFSLS